MTTTLGPKNVPGRIQQALVKHKEDRAAELGIPSSSVSRGGVSASLGSVKPKIKRVSSKPDVAVTPQEYNRLVATLEQSRDYFNKVTDLSDALAFHTSSSRKSGAEQRVMMELCEKSKRSALKATKLLARPKTFARKTTGNVAMFEYREMISVIKQRLQWQINSRAD